MEQKKFGKDFLMVLSGQIISLFGNAVIRCVIWKYYRNRVFAVDRNDTDRRDDR